MSQAIPSTRSAVTPVANRAGTAARGTESELLVRHLRGDAGAFAELVALYRAPVYSFLSRSGVGPEDRDDLFQEVFLRVHRAAPRFRPELELHPWLFTIAANAVRNHLRRQRVRQLTAAEPPAAEPEDPAADSERQTAARELVGWLERQIPRLPAAQREVLLLASVESRPLKEVAGVLGIPLNTVKTRLRRARLALIEARLRREAVPEAP